MIVGNGSLVLKVYYTRNSYTVTFDGNGGTIKSSQYSYEDRETKTYTAKYGGKVTAPEFTRTGYTQNGWDKELPETISGDITLSAVWNINRYTLTFVYGNGQPDKQITQDYDTAIEAPEEPAARNGYDFGGWNIPKTMPAEYRTIYAQWKAIFNLNESGDTITGLTYYGSSKTQLEIPEEIDGVKITLIESATFKGWNGAYNEKNDLKYLGSKNNPYLFLVKVSKNLATYEIDSSCKYIGSFAFCDCSSLTSITIPDCVTSIGSYAFGWCSSLTSITIPSSVTSIGDLAFHNCGKLAYNVKDGLEYLGNAKNKYLYLADTNSTTITTAQIDGNCRLIGSYAFSGCSSLTRITLPDSVLSIGDGAFNSCISLIRVTIPNSVISIGSAAFSGCIWLDKVYYKGTAKEWGKISGSSRDNLESVTKYYYSETKPTESGNFWHYNDKNEIVEW